MVGVELAGGAEWEETGPKGIGADPVGACGSRGGLGFSAWSKTALWEASGQGKDLI